MNNQDVGEFYQLLIARETDVAAIAGAILAVAELARIPRFDYALALESNLVEGWITNNNIVGYVALHYNQDKPASPLIALF